MACLLSAPLSAGVQLLESPANGSAFPLVANGKAAVILLPKRAPEVVQIAAGNLAEDIEAVTGTKPVVTSSSMDVYGLAHIQLELAPQPAERWDAYRLSATEDSLTILGSDPRGLAFGIYELSRRIGVSPWAWWADVPVTQRKNLYLSPGQDPIEQPAVKYRGIFLNDEGWGLRPWAAQTYEPEVGNIGPKTYSKIFELILRLRANTIWPAMHPGTEPFFQVPGNAEAADRYAIVVGSSHAEPMLRNNVGEWKQDKKHYNYVKHRAGVLEYWEERVKQRSSGESLFTLGMRGIHDSHMQGGGSQSERIALLEKIFADQRELLARYLGDGDPAKVAQIFVPYKEVLGDYNAGLEVPEDVTLVWPDDNFGYIRRFPTQAEAARKGGTGVYYHLSYLGAPLSYLWIDNMSLALTWAEMTRAYEQGVREVWIGNVGDIKNTERSMEYFLDLAWRADETTPDDSREFLHRTATRDFGADEADAITDVLQRLEAINVQRRAEHTQWHLPKTGYQPTALNENEIIARLKASAQLLADSEAIRNRLPPEARDAYFQLVHYPVAVTAAADERYFYAELARLQKARGLEQPAEETYAKVAPAFKRIEALTAYYNNDVSGGKWRHIVRNWGMPYHSWYVNYRNTSSLPALDSDAQKKIQAAEPQPEASPLPRPEGARPGDFVERDGAVSIDAGHFTDRQDLPSGAGWRSVPGLGRTGSAVTVLPSTATITGKAAPSLEYRFYVESSGKPTIRVRLLPTFPLPGSEALRFAIAIDKRAACPMAVTDGFDTTRKPWKFRVLDNATSTTLKLDEPLSPGWHTLRLIAVDAGVVVDQIVIEFKEQAASYDGPAETRID